MGKVRWAAWCSRSRKCPVRRKRSSSIRESQTVLPAETSAFVANPWQMAQQKPAQRQECRRNVAWSVMSLHCWRWWCQLMWDLIVDSNVRSHTVCIVHLNCCFGYRCNTEVLNIWQSLMVIHLCTVFLDECLIISNGNDHQFAGWIFQERLKPMSDAW